jgi:hypothetical protein
VENVALIIALIATLIIIYIVQLVKLVFINRVMHVSKPVTQGFLIKKISAIVALQIILKMAFHVKVIL